MENFNELTAAEAERLSLLLEEMGEAIQMIGKIQRHGYNSFDPTKIEEYIGQLLYPPTNRQRLENELGHVRCSIVRLCKAGDLSKRAISESANEKARTVIQWLHHQPSL